MEQTTTPEPTCQAQSHGAHLDRKAIGMLRTLGQQAFPPRAAVIGWRGVAELMAIAKGLVRGCNERGISADYCMHCLHWNADAEFARRTLAEGDARFTDPARGWKRANRKPRNWRCGTIKLIGADDGTRDAWADHVAAMVEGGDEGYGIVIHIAGGKERDIRGDLAVLTPVIGPDTTIAICDVHQRGPSQAFEYMRTHEGWDGVEIADTGILQRRDGPKE